MDKYPSGQLRVSDAERDRAIEELSEHYQAGRLTLAEFDERSDQALHAKTGSDLTVLFNDLPRLKRPVAPAPDPLPTTAPAGRLVPLVATLASALVVVAVSLLAVAQPHHHVIVLVPIVLWLFVIRRLIRVHGGDHHPR